jgi:hypothetical protein
MRWYARRRASLRTIHNSGPWRLTSTTASRNDGLQRRENAGLAEHESGDGIGRAGVNILLDTVGSLIPSTGRLLPAGPCWAERCT